MEYGKDISQNREALLGIAILMVVIYHAFCLNLPVWGLDIIVKYGFLGVDIFMFLSAMGLCRSLENNGLSTFYRNRAIRILPLYFALVLFRCIYDGLFGGGNLSITDCLTMATTLSFWGIGNGVFVDWYLTSIIYFYLLFPVIYQLIRSAGFSFVITLSTISFFLIVFVIENWQYQCAVARIPIFISGIFLCISNFRKSDLTKVIMMFIVFFVLNLLSGKDGTIYWTSPAIIAITLLFVQKTIRFSSILSFLGRYTLEVYVANCMVMSIISLMSVVYNDICLWVLYIIGNITISVLLHMVNKKVREYIMLMTQKDSILNNEDNSDTRRLR